MSLSVIILAAGQGKRMHSALPKVLHPLAGRPLLEHVYHTAVSLPRARISIVYGHGGELVRARFLEWQVEWVPQRQQLGTGHAVQQAVPNIRAADTVLILYGDVPLIRRDTLRALLRQVGRRSLGLLTVNLVDPGGYGRIVRDAQGRVTHIVEHKDASRSERRIKEVNTGMLAVHGAALVKWVKALRNRNAQKEYYLTDVIAKAVAEGVAIKTVQPAAVQEVMGVNDRAQLAQLERYLQRQQAQALMLRGVSLADPNRIDIRGTLKTGQDVTLDINTVFEGEVTLGNNVTVGPNVLIRNSTIADGSQILANCVIEDARIGQDVRIGPFARIRPGTQLEDQAHIGNFVEIKKSAIGRGSKVNHLSYIGDTQVGEDCNIGAGTITCNYDGAHKHKTIIGDDVFIGSDTLLVAPVRVADGATLGAGTILTRDAPANKLTLSRAPLKTYDSWKRPRKTADEPPGSRGKQRK